MAPKIGNYLIHISKVNPKFSNLPQDPTLTKTPNHQLQEINFKESK